MGVGGQNLLLLLRLRGNGARKRVQIRGGYTLRLIKLKLQGPFHSGDYSKALIRTIAVYSHSHKLL